MLVLRPYRGHRMPISPHAPFVAEHERLVAHWHAFISSQQVPEFYSGALLAVVAGDAQLCSHCGHF